MSVEAAAKAEISTLSAEVRSSTLAQAALLLARRMDAEPADREAVQLARELRITLAELRRRGGEEVDDGVERILGGLAGPNVSDAGD